MTKAAKYTTMLIPGLCAVALAASVSFSNGQSLPPAVAAAGEKAVITLHAEGAQVYECKADAAGKLVWTFREPVATLTDSEGKTVGRHYAGPKWELVDGGLIAGKVAGRADGASPDDIPLLKLDATVLNDKGVLAKVTTIQRLATRGGQASGACERAGAFKSVAYSADYVFLVKT